MCLHSGQSKTPECPHLSWCSRVTPLLKPCMPTPHLEHKLQENSICRQTCPAAVRRNMAPSDSYSTMSKTSSLLRLKILLETGPYFWRERPQHTCTASDPTSELQKGTKAGGQLHIAMSLPRKTRLKNTVIMRNLCGENVSQLMF